MLLAAQDSYQQGQRAVIAQIEAQLTQSQLNFSVVEPVADFINDSRLALTSVHFLRPTLVSAIEYQILQPLRELLPGAHYYDQGRLHFTIKNIRTVADPPEFSDQDVTKAKQVFTKITSRHQAFFAYYYRLIVFPHSVALLGTTDPELDSLILDLDQGLITTGVPDNKKYLNTNHFFSNITLARFSEPVSSELQTKVMEISAGLKFDPYLIDTVTLLTANAAMFQQQVHGQYQLPTVLNRSGSVQS